MAITDMAQILLLLLRIFLDMLVMSKARSNTAQERHIVDAENGSQTYNEMCFRSHDRSRQCDLLGTRFRVLNQN